MYEELLNEIKMYYNIALTKYEYHVNNEGELKSDAMFYEWLRNNIKDIFNKLDKFNIEEASVISKLKLVRGSFIDELSWEESNRKSLRSTIVNNLMGLPDEIERIGEIKGDV